MGSVRRECLDHILILSERHLHRVIGDRATFMWKSKQYRFVLPKVCVA